MVRKQVRGKYTQEYKEQAVRQAKAGPSLSAAAQILGIPKGTLSNWVLQADQGKLTSTEPDKKPLVVTPEQMEVARLRAEVARLTIERDIAKKAAAYFAQDVLQSTPGSKK